MTHTPTPWAWRGGNDELRTLADKGKYNYGRLVLYVGSDGDGGCELKVSEDDARLIAAAPKMLEALKAFVEYRDRVGALGFQLEKADDYIRDMRAAIASAERNRDRHNHHPRVRRRARDRLPAADVRVCPGGGG